MFTPCSDNVQQRTRADNRRAVLQWGGERLQAKLVDLPCPIESQKTFDRKQFYKVGPIAVHVYSIVWFFESCFR